MSINKLFFLMYPYQFDIRFEVAWDKIVNFAPIEIERVLLQCYN